MPSPTRGPSLPMFLVESKKKPRSNLTRRADSESSALRRRSNEGHFGPDPAHAHSGIVDSDSVARSHRKSHRRQASGSHDQRSGEEVLVHGHHHHRSHPRKLRHKPQAPLQEDSVMDEHGDTVTHSGTVENTSSQKAMSIQAELTRDIERLTASNKELTKRLQMSHSSMDSGYQNTVTDDVIRDKDQHIMELQSKLTDLKKNYRELEKQKDIWRSEIENLKHEYLNQHHTNTLDTEKISSLESQNQELTEDVALLKNLVCKLNMELQRYQQKLHKPSASGELPPLNVDTKKVLNEKDVAILWNNINKSTLQPLLNAYEETIKEKDDLIRDYERDLNKFMTECRQVVSENEVLHQQMEHTGRESEEVHAEEQVLRQELANLREENELLVDQVKQQNLRIQQMHDSSQEKVAELTAIRESLCDKLAQCRTELLTTQGQYSTLKEQYALLRNDCEDKVPLAVHSASVAECRRLFEELKARYEAETSKLMSQVQQLSQGKTDLETKIVDVTADNKQLQAHVKMLERLLNKSQQRAEELTTRLVTLQVSRDSSKRQLHKAMSFAEELVGEQEGLLRQLHARQEETNSIARLGSTIVYRMGSLKSKLKTVQQGAWEELGMIERRIREQETGVERMKDNYHKEVVRLRGLLKQKEAIIGRLQRDKTKTEEELEVVWRAATSRDITLKDRFKHVTFEPEKNSSQSAESFE